MKVRLRFSSALFVIVFANGPVQSPAVTGTISRYAGPSYPISGTPAITQFIGTPGPITADGSGGFYVSTSHHRIYRISLDGILTVKAGSGAYGFSGDGGSATSALLSTIGGLGIDASGNLFIADSANHRVRKVTPGGLISTVAGNGIAGFGGDGGPAILAQLNSPLGVAVDPTGNVFIADRANERIRKVTPDGVITTVAGTGTRGDSGDGGPAISAQLRDPSGVAVSETGNLFITGSSIRKVTPDGIISTVAFVVSGSVAVDRFDNLFVAEFENLRVVKVTPQGLISTVAGNGTPGFSGDGGPATAARVWPNGVAMDGSGNLFISDYQNRRVRKVTTDGVIHTVAGAGEDEGFSGDGGPATSARLMHPLGMAVDGSGNLYIADRGNERIRKVTKAGLISTVAGTGTPGFGGDGGPATAAQLRSPWGVAVNRSGDLFIADTGNHRVRKVTPDGVITTVGGNGALSLDSSEDDVPATSVQLNPYAVAIDASDNLFVADGNNHIIRKVTPGGVISTVAGTGTWGFSGDGGPAVYAQLSDPAGLAFDGSGNLYIADRDNSRIRKVTSDGLISTVAGNGTWGFNGDGGPATSAQLSDPWGVAVDGAGNLFIADRDNSRICKVTPDGVMSTLAGKPRAMGFSGDDGPAASAQFSYPVGLTVDGFGDLFIADEGTDRVRKVTFTQPTVFSLYNRGGLSWKSSGSLPSTVVGYAAILPDNDSPAPAGQVIVAFRRNDVLVSEVAIPGSRLIHTGRAFAEVGTLVNTGIAIANPNSQAAMVSFYFTDSNGNLPSAFSNGVTTIPAHAQISGFLSEPPFNAPSPFMGTFTFSSSLPVAAIALRGLTNERSDLIMTSLPITDLQAPLQTGTVVFPHFACGGGWTTQIILVNSGDAVLTGTVGFLDPTGRPAMVDVNYQSNATFAYSIPPRSFQKLSVSTASSIVQSGSVRVVPAPNTPVPSGLAVLSFALISSIDGYATVAQGGVPAMAPGTAFRLYAELGDSIITGVAVANSASDPTTVTLELRRFDGSLGLAETLTIPANGQMTFFPDHFAGPGPLPYEGTFRLSSATPVAVIGLRTYYNARGDTLITTTPPFDETRPSTGPMFFPHIVDSGGYTTQFILLSVGFTLGIGPSASGTIQLLNQAGGTLGVIFRS